MKTIKLLLLAALCIVTINTNAQDKKPVFGVKAGFSFANFANYSNDEALTGFNAGITLDFNITKQWYLLTGLEYSSKKMKLKAGLEQDIAAAYIQLPLYAGYKFRFTDALALLVNAGPYVAYGIHGKIKTGSFEEKTFDDQTLKNLDAGINIGATLEWQKFCVGIGSEMGLINVMQKRNVETKIANVTFTIGYKF